MITVLSRQDEGVFDRACMAVVCFVLDMHPCKTLRLFVLLSSTSRSLDIPLVTYLDCRYILIAPPL